MEQFLDKLACALFNLGSQFHGTVNTRILRSNCVRGNDTLAMLTACLWASLLEMDLAANRVSSLAASLSIGPLLPCMSLVVPNALWLPGTY